MSEKISEESVPVQELKPTTTISIRRLVRTVLVISLSLLCIVGGILLYQLSLDDFETMPYPRRNIKSIGQLSGLKQGKSQVKPEKKPAFASLPKIDSEMKNDLKSNSFGVTKTEDVVKTDKAVPEKNVENEKVPVLDKAIVNSLPEKDEHVNNNQSVEVVPAIELNPEPVAVEPAPVMEETYIALGKALRLRDQLQSGKPCLDSLQMILKTRLPDEKQRDVLTEKLVPVCSASSAFQDLNALFLKNKKSALMTYYQNTTDNRFLAYFKAVMSTLVDIRRLNPVKRKPKDIISLAQNALNMHDISQAVDYIQSLPADIQANFLEFSELARAYLSAQEATEALIFSFEKKGK